MILWLVCISLSRYSLHHHSSHTHTRMQAYKWKFLWLLQIPRIGNTRHRYKYHIPNMIPYRSHRTSSPTNDTECLSSFVSISCIISVQIVVFVVLSWFLFAAFICTYVCTYMCMWIKYMYVYLFLHTYKDVWIYTCMYVCNLSA